MGRMKDFEIQMSEDEMIENKMQSDVLREQEINDAFERLSLAFPEELEFYLQNSDLKMNDLTLAEKEIFVDYIAYTYPEEDELDEDEESEEMYNEEETEDQKYERYQDEQAEAQQEMNDIARSDE